MRLLRRPAPLSFVALSSRCHDEPWRGLARHHLAYYAAQNSGMITAMRTSSDGWCCRVDSAILGLFVIGGKLTRMRTSFIEISPDPVSSRFITAESTIYEFTLANLPPAASEKIMINPRAYQLGSCV